MGILKEYLKKCDWPLHLNSLGRRGFVLVLRGISTGYFKLKLEWYGCSYGCNLRVHGKIHLRSYRRGRFKFGDNVTLTSSFSVNLVGLTNPIILDVGKTGYIEIGDNSGCSSVIISSLNQVIIGENVKVGGNVRIFDHDFHSLDAEVRRTNLDKMSVKSKPIRIGDDVFIGTNSIILKGVTIGDRAIVAAGSIVSSNIPADEVWGGNPARRIRGASSHASLVDKSASIDTIILENQ